ncbi:MAG TPA: nucleotidyl transferase AbiEii/AbiGii toxin family protein [Marmoricola sp.]|nr:nucleotidyl transferase AbiEii/AbiGii toxin family protein [Marmoricola sp.]
MSRTTRATAAGRAYLDLQNRARRDGRGTQEYLTGYVVERWLSRLSRSPYAEDFVLKGGVLLAAYGQRRPTADADALARNLANDAEAVAARVAEIASIEDSDDGVEFLPETVVTQMIRDDTLYHGMRVVLDARIATAHVKLRIDVNFGDPVTPGPQIIELPALRSDQEPVRLLGYPIETLLAEKIATAMLLGEANTRVRDFADVYTLTGAHQIARPGDARGAAEDRSLSRARAGAALGGHREPGRPAQPGVRRLPRGIGAVRGTSPR